MDFSSVKVITIPEGDVRQITRKSDGVVLWKAITFTNQVPISADTGGISSSAQNGSVTIGYKGE